MLLKDFLSLLDEESKIVIFENGEEVATSENEIPAKYKSRPVKSITAGYYQIDIDL